MSRGPRLKVNHSNYFLSNPHQRITRYGILLGSILKRCPDATDKLKTTFDNVDGLCRWVSCKIRDPLTIGQRLQKNLPFSLLIQRAWHQPFPFLIRSFSFVISWRNRLPNEDDLNFKKRYSVVFESNFCNQAFLKSYGDGDPLLLKVHCEHWRQKLLRVTSFRRQGPCNKVDLTMKTNPKIWPKLSFSD